MNRKEYEHLYERIAASIHRTGMASTIGKKKTSGWAIRLAAIDLAATLEHDNPAFDRARFLKACGINP